MQSQVHQLYCLPQKRKISLTFSLSQPILGMDAQGRKCWTLCPECWHAEALDRSVTNGWWNKFLCCHPILSVRTPATLSVTRARASTRETIDNYFDILEETLQETGLLDYPALYFNMDESGFALDPKSMKTIHIRGEKKSFPFLVGQSPKSL